MNSRFSEIVIPGYASSTKLKGKVGVSISNSFEINNGSPLGNNTQAIKSGN